MHFSSLSRLVKERILSASTISRDNYIGSYLGSMTHDFALGCSDCSPSQTFGEKGQKRSSSNETVKTGGDGRLVSISKMVCRSMQME